MQESLDQFAKRVGLLELGKADQIRHLAWFLHTVSGKDRIITGDIRACYEELHLSPPNVSHYLGYLADGKTRSFIRDKRGFRLEGSCRSRLAAALEEHGSVVTIRTLLTDLIQRLSDHEERVYLEETLRCYGVKAYRASVVMAWNLAYSHLENWILADPTRVDRFNASLSVKYPKRTERILNIDSFSEFKEFEVIETAAHAKLISKGVSELLKDKLKRRNAAAHPSSVVITQAQADDVITDLVNNVVAKLG